MRHLTVLINTIDKVKEFVQIVSHFEGELDLSISRYTIDAKSIMGIFSLDISQPLQLTVYDEKAFPALKEALAAFILPEEELSPEAQ